jgi:hypothetical protein
MLGITSFRENGNTTQLYTQVFKGILRQAADIHSRLRVLVALNLGACFAAARLLTRFKMLLKPSNSKLEWVSVGGLRR